MPATATVRDLRYRFLQIKKLVEQEGEVVVTEQRTPKGAIVKTLIRLAGLFALLTVGFSVSEPGRGIVGAADGPVRVEGGLISGVTDVKSGVTAFKGMPFAAPPTGDLRWRPPAPVKAWEGVRQADRYSAPCLQPAFPGGSLELDEILRLPGAPQEDSGCRRTLRSSGEIRGTSRSSVNRPVRGASTFWSPAHSARVSSTVLSARAVRSCSDCRTIPSCPSIPRR
jgi:hypothetical protein